MRELNIPKKDMRQAAAKTHDAGRAALRRALRHARRACRLKQAEVAARLSVPQSFVSKYEAGQRRLDLVDLLAVCAALETDLASFLAMFEAELAKDDNGEA